MSSLIPASPGFKGFGEASVELARTSVGLLLELGEDDIGAVTVFESERTDRMSNTTEVRSL